jgi:hypothetical protein
MIYKRKRKKRKKEKKKKRKKKEKKKKKKEKKKKYKKSKEGIKIEKKMIKPHEIIWLDSYCLTMIKLFQFMQIG